MDPSAGVWRTYLRAFAFLLPSVLAWSFAVTFLLPKVRQLWQDAGLTTSKAQWLMESCTLLLHSAPYVFGAVILFLLLAELLWSAWPRYRRVVVACVTLLLHTAVLAGITSVAIAACLAAPVLAKHK